MGGKIRTGAIVVYIMIILLGLMINQFFRKARSYYENEEK
jgi:hypothetical protein